MRDRSLRILQGGLPVAGEVVRVEGRKATVIQAAFSTHVFRGDASVRFENGELELIPLERIRRQKQP